MIRFRSPTTTPLHPFGADVPVGTFRVTQRFDDPDFFYRDGRTHGAVDIGNRQCGAPIVAMAPGTASRIKDNATALGAKTDALGIRIDHGQGVSTEYWHLASWGVASGSKVNAGQVIGWLGSTGLGNVCHTHIEMKVDGQRIDPEPYMFGAVFDPAPEDDVLGDQTIFLDSPFRARIAAGVSIRSQPRLSDDTRVSITSAVTEVTVIGRTSGAEFRGSRNWHVFGEDRGGLRCVHSSLTERITATPIGIDNKIAGALTAAKGAQQAINVVVSNLEALG